MASPPPQTRPAPHFLAADNLSPSVLEGLVSKDITQYLKITKLTLQKYLEACVDENGQFRKFFEKFATFTADYTINENLSRDANVRHLQIARFFDQVRENPPQIFIQDGGYSYVPSSLGGFATGFNVGTPRGEQVVRIMDVIPIPIEITVAAQDEQVCEDLQAFLSAAFGQFQRFTCNWILSPPRRQVIRDDVAAYWEVRIPLPHMMGSKSHAPLHDDPNDQIWEATLTMEVEFENSTYIHYRAAPQFDQLSGSLRILVPDKIELRRSHPVTMADLAFPFRIYSDDSRIAVIEQTQTRFTIRPKKIGRFNVVVTRPGSDGRRQASVLATKAVEVVARLR